MSPVLTPRRVLASLLLPVLVVLGVGVLASPASAAEAPRCACTGTTTQDYVRQADAVFTGVVTSSMSVPGPDSKNGFVRAHETTVERVYKGDIATEAVGVIAARSFGQCGGKLVVDKRYVFFVLAGETLEATGCGGTSRATPDLQGKVERLLGTGRAPVPETPVEAVLTPVNTDAPPTLSRAAAPGLAMVIVGLLGLVVVRSLARPRRLT